MGNSWEKYEEERAKRVECEKQLEELKHRKEMEDALRKKDEETRKQLEELKHRKEMEDALWKKDEETRKQLEEMKNQNKMVQIAEENKPLIKTESLAVMERIKDEKLSAKKNVLVFGPTGHGKSSLCNSLMVAVNDYKKVKNYFTPGNAAKSFTKKFQMAPLGYINIIDMFGLFDEDSTEEQRKKFEDRFREILRGKDTQMLKDLGISEPVNIQLVIIVLRHQEPTEKVKRMINIVNDLAGRMEFLTRLVITHADQICPELDDSRMLQEIGTNEKVKKIMKQMSEATGVSDTAAHVIINYHGNMTPDLFTKHHHLKFLDVMMDDIDTQIQKKKQKGTYAQ